jgi:hypothetical protein
MTKIVIVDQSSFEKMALDVEEIKKSIAELKNGRHEGFLTVQDAARIYKICPRTQLIWRNKGILGFTQVGNKIYYRTSDFESLSENHHIKSRKNQ